MSPVRGLLLPICYPPPAALTPWVPTRAPLLPPSLIIMMMLNENVLIHFSQYQAAPSFSSSSSSDSITVSKIVYKMSVVMRGTLENTMLRFCYGTFTSPHTFVGVALMVLASALHAPPRQRPAIKIVINVSMNNYTSHQTPQFAILLV